MAATASSLTTISALLKQRYLDASLIQNSMIDFGPLTAELIAEADTSCGGSTTPFPLIYSGGGGFSSSMAAAYATATPAASVNFLMTRATVFGQIVLGGEAMAASENPDGAFIADLALEVDTKRRRLHEYVSALVYGDGTGVMAQMLSFATGVITLTDGPQAARFQVNDVINLGGSGTHNAAGAGAASASGGVGNLPPVPLYVIGVNIPAGQITVSATQGGTPLPTIATAFTGTGDNVPATLSFIYFNGDANTLAAGTIPANTGGFGNAILSGLTSWIPILGVPSSGDSQFGVNRYGNSSLVGLIVDGTYNGLNLGTIRATLTNAVSQLRQVGSKPKKVMIHPIAFYKLSLELQSQGMYPGTKGQGPSGEGSFGFSTLMLPTDAGDLPVIADPQCLPALTNLTSYTPALGYSGSMTAFILDDNWEMIAKGDPVHLDETDGNYFLRIQGTDNYQIQEKGYLNLGTHRPNGSAMCFLPQ